MVTQTLAGRAALNEKLMSLLSDLTGMALGLYLEEGGQERIEITGESWERFERFCKEVRADPARRERCDRDHFDRARVAQEPCLNVCHAGMINFCVPAAASGSLRAVLIGGELQLTDSEWQARSDANFARFVRECGIDEREAQRLLALRRQGKHVSEADFKREVLPKVQRVFDVFVEYLRTFESYEQDAEAIAHNFSTQLLVVFSHAHQLQRVLQSMPNTRREIKESARDVLNSITVLSDIVTSYLESYEDATIRFKPERIESLIRRSASVYRAEAAERDIDIHIDIEPADTPIMVQCSREHVMVALRNLVHNAVKYSYAGNTARDRSRVVAIGGRRKGIGYEISVENYGVGIDPDEYELIFQRGYQGRQTRREHRSGAGRGLSLTRHYIRMHHGSINVHSECVGDPDDTSRPQPYLTRFVVWLPLEQREEVKA